MVAVCECPVLAGALRKLSCRRDQDDEVIPTTREFSRWRSPSGEVVEYDFDVPAHFMAEPLPDGRGKFTQLTVFVGNLLQHETSTLQLFPAHNHVGTDNLSDRDYRVNAV